MAITIHNYIYGSVYNTYDMSKTKQLTVAGLNLKRKAIKEIKEMYEGRVATLRANPHGCGTPDYRRAELDTLEMVIGDLTLIEQIGENL